MIELHGCGVVEPVFRYADRSAWVLALDVLAHMNLSLALTSPVLALAHPDGKPAHQWTHYQLMDYLDESNWQMVVLASRAQHRHIKRVELQVAEHGADLVYPERMPPEGIPLRVGVDRAS